MSVVSPMKAAASADHYFPNQPNFSMTYEYVPLRSSTPHVMYVGGGAGGEYAMHVN